MKQLIFIVILVSCFIHLSIADEPRIRTEFFSKDSVYTIKYNLNKNWILKDNKGKIISKINDENFASMTIRISNDGNSIIVIDDFAEERIIKNRTAVWFFYKGNLTKKYKFTDLITDTCNITYSKWHLIWLVSSYDLNESQNLFEFATNEFFEYSFNPETGELIKKQRPNGYDNSTLIVFGIFEQTKGKETEMEILRYIVGEKQPNDKIKFKTEAYGDGNWRTAIMIKNRIDITPSKFQFEVLINNCLP